MKNFKNPPALCALGELEWGQGRDEDFWEWHQKGLDTLEKSFYNTNPLETGRF